MASVKSGKKIVKASGETEFFDPNVITTECREAGIEFWTSSKVALEVSERIYDGISTGEIQKATLEVLTELSPEAADAYRRFHSMHVRTSRNTIEPFDRKKITLSLIRETRLPKEVAEQIAGEAEAELRRLKLDFVSAPLIREVANVKLLEHGFEEARADYTRLGIPIYDVTQLLGYAPRDAEGVGSDLEGTHRSMAGDVLKEYTLLKVLPLHLADANMRGEIYIHDLDCFVTRPYSAWHDLRWFLKVGLVLDGGNGPAPVRGPAGRLESALLSAAKVISVASSKFSGMQCLDFFNVWLAPFAKGRDYGQLRQLAQEFMYEVGQGCPVQFPVSIVVEYGVPELLEEMPAVLPGGKVSKKATYSDFEEEARLLGRAFAEVSAEGDSAGRPFLSPAIGYRLRGENLKKEGYPDFMKLVHECASKFGAARFFNFRGRHAPDYGPRSGGLQLVTVNLPRVACESKGVDSRFFELIEDRLTLVRETMAVKREILKNRMENGLMPFLSREVEGEPYFRMEEALNLVGYVGLNEAVEKHTGEELHAGKDPLKFGHEVIAYMADRMEEWSEEQGLRWALAQTPEGVASSRLAKLDFGSFSDRAVVRGDRGTGAVYYTPSSQVNRSAPIDPLKRLEIEGSFHRFTPGGMDACVDVEGLEVGRLQKLTEEIILKTDVGFFRYVKKITSCGSCRKTFEGHFNSCPRCGSPEVMRC